MRIPRLLGRAVLPWATLAVLLMGCSAGKEGLLVPATVVDDPDLPQFELRDGRRVHLETFGDPADPVLIMLHGGPGGDYRGYLHFEEELSDYFVVLWDQRGTGLSERVPNEEMDGPTYVADLHELGESFSPDQPFHLVGHSWGGAYAAYYTQNYPKRVDHLVLVEPGALNPAAANAGNTTDLNLLGGRTQDFLQSTDYLLPDADAEADYFYVVALSGFGDRDEELLGYDFWRLGYRANVAINTWQGNFDGSHSFDATQGISQFSGPTLFLTGTSDGRLGHDFQMDHHVPHFNEVSVVQLPDTEHSDLLVQPEALTALRGFLQ
jgi:proline iminopeptidase